MNARARTCTTATSMQNVKILMGHLTALVEVGSLEKLLLVKVCNMHRKI